MDFDTGAGITFTVGGDAPTAADPKDGTGALTAQQPSGPAAADFNSDGIVDALDLGRVRVNFGNASLVCFSSGDSNLDGSIDAIDLAEVRTHFGTVIPVATPEPTLVLLLGVAGVTVFHRRKPL